MIPHETRVRLSVHDVIGAYIHAAEMQMDSFHRNLADRPFPGTEKPGPGAHILGALAEYAVGRYARIPPRPAPPGTFHGPYLGADVQVRGRMYDGLHDLCIRSGDPLDDWYYLAWCHRFPFLWSIPGHIQGHHGKRIGTPHAGRWWVTAEQLTRGCHEELARRHDDIPMPGM